MYRQKTNLVLGRGEVYFDRFIGTSRDGERYFGNTPAFRIEREVKRLERTTSYRGQKQQKRSAVVQETMSISMTTDHMASENVALWHGVDGELTAPGDTFIPYSESIVVKKDRFYQIGLGVTGVGLGYLDVVSVRMNDINGQLLTVGVHYHLDRQLGRIQIPPSAPIVDGSTIFVRYVKRPSPVRIATPVATEIYGALRYVATDPYGPQGDYYFPQVRITPKGAVDLKGDEFRQMSFDIEAIRLAPNLPLVYLMMDRSAPLPITADTTLLRADTTLYRADVGAWE